MKPEFRIGEMHYDSTALPTIKKLYTQQLDQFEQRTAQELGLSFYRLQQTTTTAIATFWERSINRPNGLAYVSQFLTKLSQKLDELQQSVQGKSQEAKSSFNALKLEAHEEKLKEASETFFKNKNTIQAACQRYKERADQKWKTYLHLKRCDKAAELYGVLRVKVEEIQEKCQHLHSNLDKVYRDLEQSYHEVSRQGNNDNSFIHTIQRINLQSKRPKVTGEDLVESMWAIMPSTSLLEPDVRLWVHPAPDVLSLRFCSCACSRDNSRELLRGYFSSSWRDLRRCDAGEPVLRR